MKRQPRTTSRWTRRGPPHRKARLPDEQANSHSLNNRQRLSVGHVSPEAAAGGTIALVEDGDIVTIDIPHRTIQVDVGDEELQRRRAGLLASVGGYRPRSRERVVSVALRAYAALALSADKGAVRDVSAMG